MSPLKKRPSHCRRGLAARLAAKKKISSEEEKNPAAEEISVESAIYSTQVARMLSKRGIPDVARLNCVVSSNYQLKIDL